MNKLSIITAILLLISLNVFSQGQCLSFDGIDDYVQIGNDLYYNFTIEVWIKTDTPGPAGTYAYQGDGIAWSDVWGDADDFVLALLGNNLSFWDGKSKTNITGTTNIADDEWHHIAVSRISLDPYAIYSGNNTTIYVDGNIEASMPSSTDLLDANPVILIGGNTLDGNYFKGLMDEFRAWGVGYSSIFGSEFGYALNTKKIREWMHICGGYKDDDKTNYLSFNYSVGYGALYNMGSGIWLNSTAPVGNGSGKYLSINNAGNFNFTTTGVILDVTSTIDSCDMVVSKIDNPTNLPVSEPDVFSGQYWIFDKYGSGMPVGNATFVFDASEDLTEEDQLIPGNIKLYYRESDLNGDWTYYRSATSVDATTNSATFDNISIFGQFLIIRKDSDSPKIKSLSPINSGVDVGQSVNLNISFLEPVKVGSGNIYIKKISDNTIFETINVTSGNITGRETTTITINPVQMLLDDTEFYIEMDAGAFSDMAGNNFAGISGSETWRFKVINIAPAITRLYPGNILDIPKPITITFNEVVVADKGYITIKDTNNKIIEAIDVNSVDITGIDTSVITINHTQLVTGDSYYIQIDSTAFKDLGGNHFPGISDTDSWRFKTNFFIPFTSIPNVPGFSTWADYDNDGDLDLFSFLEDKNWLFNNEGGVFTETSLNIASLGIYKWDWGDYDNDGDIDIAISGANSNISFCRIYRNDNGIFTDINATLEQTQTEFSNLKWGDYDNDGDLDLFCYRFLYRNDENNFIKTNLELLEGHIDGLFSCSWGDYDNDGDLDVVAGSGVVYRNDNGSLVIVKQNLFNGLLNTVNWADVDGDGDLDILITGHTSLQVGTFGYAIYYNNGGEFIGQPVYSPDKDIFQAQPGDYNNDGNLDFLLRNNCTDVYIYKNISTGFDIYGPLGWPIPASSYSFMINNYGDFDNDGDLDMTMQSTIMRNESNPTKITPDIPRNLLAQNKKSNVFFSWESPSDMEAPNNNLTYNLRVGTTPGGNEIVSCMSNSDGHRLVSQPGMQQTSKHWRLNLPYGRYYWSVQSVNNAFTGSAFVEEQMLDVVMDPPGNALQFDGIDDFVQIDNPVIPGTGDFSVELWVNVATDKQSFNEIISQDAGSGTNFFIGFTPAGNIRVSDAWPDTEIPFPKDSTWHHLAVTKCSDSTSLYLDGVLMAVKKEDIGNPAGNIFRIGNQYGLYKEYFAGKVDEIRIWNTELSPQNLIMNMNSLPDINNTNLAAYFDFDEGINGQNISSETHGIVHNRKDINNGIFHGYSSSDQQGWIESYAMIVPTGTSASEVLDSSFVANWKTPAIGEINKYLLEIATDSTFLNVVAGYSPVSINADTNSILITGLSPNSDYYYRLRAVKSDSIGKGAFSNIIKVKTLSNIPRWNGTGPWEQAESWTSNEIPPFGSNIMVETGVLSIDRDVDLNNIYINQGAAISIQPNQTLVLRGSVINRTGIEGLVIEADESGTGRFVSNNEGVMSSVQSFFKSEQWKHFGIPIAEDVDLSSYFSRFEVVQSSETLGETNSWNQLQPDDILTVAKGYGVYYQQTSVGDTTITFTGTLNTGEIMSNTTYTNNAENTYGWNFISNPYPCYIDWRYIVTSGLNNVNDAFYVYDPNTGSYSSYIDGVKSGSSRQDQFIAPMQGFFVKAHTADGSVVFSNGSKVISTTSEQNVPAEFILRLTVESSDNLKDETVVRVHNNATNNFDGHFDAYKILPVNTETPQLYTEDESNRYSINTLQSVTKDSKIDLKVLAKKQESYTIKLSEVDNNNLPIFLYNPLTEEIVNLLTTSYSFTADPDQIIFLQLRFSDMPTNSISVWENNIVVITKDRGIYISDLANGESRVYLYDIKGQIIHSGSTNNETYSIEGLPIGVFILRLQNKDGKCDIKKVVIF